jgi:hypothetical protein
VALTKNQKDTIGFKLESFKKLNPKKEPLTEEAVAEALTLFKGLQYLAAEALDVSQARVSQMINASPWLQSIRDDLLERRIDVSEYKLAEMTEEKDLGAIIWFLRTRAKHRGYVLTDERPPEHRHLTDMDKVINNMDKNGLQPETDRQLQQHEREDQHLGRGSPER